MVLNSWTVAQKMSKNIEKSGLKKLNKNIKNIFKKCIDIKYSTMLKLKLSFESKRQKYIEK